MNGVVPRVRGDASELAGIEARTCSRCDVPALPFAAMGPASQRDHASRSGKRVTICDEAIPSSPGSIRLWPIGC